MTFSSRRYIFKVPLDPKFPSTTICNCNVLKLCRTLGGPDDLTTVRFQLGLVLHVAAVKLSSMGYCYHPGKLEPADTHEAHTRAHAPVCLIIQALM